MFRDHTDSKTTERTYRISLRLITNAKSAPHRAVAPRRSRRLRAEVPKKEHQVHLASLPKTAAPLADVDAPKRLARRLLDLRPKSRNLRVEVLPRTALRLAAGVDHAKLSPLNKNPSRRSAQAAEDAHVRFSLLRQNKSKHLAESSEMLGANGQTGTSYVGRASLHINGIVYGPRYMQKRV